MTADSAAELKLAIQTNDVAGALKLLSSDPGLADTVWEAGLSAALLCRYYGRPEILEAVLQHRTRKLNVFEAAALGDSKAIEDRLSENPALLNTHSQDGFTPLHLAAFFGQDKIVLWLLSKGADPKIEATNGTALKPLNSAAACADPRAAINSCRALLDAGADVMARQRGGFNALHSAAANGHRALVELLLARGADPKSVTDDGKTPGKLAREKGHSTLAMLLKLPGLPPSSLLMILPLYSALN